MTYALGTATGKIELEYDGSGVEKAKEDVEGLKKSSGDAMAGLDKLGGVAGKAGLVIAGGLGAGVAAAANFEERISAISAVSGAMGDDLDRVRDKALQLGKDTSFSASEAASAIEELVKSGLSVEDVMNGAADATVNLAAAGEVDMPTAAAIASNAMNQFGLSAKDMPRVADLIAGAANASAIDVEDFGYSLSQAGAVANLAGVSFDDTAAAIALLGNAGIKGSDAGTSLKSMLSRLQPTTNAQFETMNRLGLITMDTGKAMDFLAQNGLKNVAKSDVHTALGQLAAELSDSEVGSAKAEKKLRELGLQTGFLSNAFYDAKGNTKGLAQISEELSQSLDGMNKRQKQAALQTLFGADAIRVAAVLADKGAKGFNKVGDAMDKVKAADVAKTRLDNFKGSLEAMKGSLETVGIQIGTILLPPLRALVDMLSSAFDVFLDLDKGTQTFIVAMLAGVAALLLVVAGIAKLIIFINSVKVAFVALRAAAIPAWLAALGPIALVIVAVAAVIAIIVLLWKKSETFRDIVTGVWKAIKSAASAVANWFKGPFVNFFTGAWDAIKNGLSAIGDFFSEVWNGITDVVSTVVNVIKTIITTYFNIYKTIFTTVLNVIKGIWSAVWGTFGGVLTAMFNLIVAIIKLGWTIVKGVFLLYLMALKAIWTTIWRQIVAVVTTVWNIIVTAIKFYVNLVKTIITSVWNAIKAVTSAVWNGIKAVISAVWGVIGGTVMSAANRVKDIITTIWNAIKSSTKAAWDAVVEAISAAWDKAWTLITGIKDKVVGFFSGAATWLYDAGKKIIQGLLDGIEAMIGKVTDKINSVTGAIGKFLPGSPVKEGPLRVLNQGYAGGQIMKMLMDGIAGQQWALQRQVGDVAGLMAHTGVAPVAYTGGRTAPKPSGNGSASGLRMLSGELSLGNGRAYVSGVAQEVFDDNGHVDGVWEGMYE